MKLIKEEKNDTDNHLRSMNILFRTIIRIQKIEKIYGKNPDRKEKF